MGRANTGGKKAVASVVEEFRPSFAMKEGARDYQILAFACVVGKVELCLTESVWRGSTKKSNTVPRPVADVVVQIWCCLLVKNTVWRLASVERSTETATVIFEETRENSLNSNSFAKANSFQKDSNTFEAKPSEIRYPMFTWIFSPSPGIFFPG